MPGPPLGCDTGAVADRSWLIDRALALDLAAALGWSPDDGVPALAALLPARVPCGSTAKLAAMDAGEVPPGSDPEAIARRILDHLAALASAPAGGAPSPSWSCWVLATVMAALVETSGLGATRVAATRRIDDRSPVVDFHSSVLVDGSGPTGHETWLCDPYFGTALTMPTDPGGATEVTLTGRRARVALEEEGRWTLEVALARWSSGLRYRVFAPVLDRGDVHALCAVSVSHSGVPSRPYARLHGAEGVLDVREDDVGAGVVADWRWPGRAEPAGRRLGTTTTVHLCWAEAADTFADRTGVRIV
ncbi:hypothetical protein BH23ACT2_BH23ACT2_18980 [soil metagenome]